MSVCGAEVASLCYPIGTSTVPVLYGRSHMSSMIRLRQIIAKQEVDG